MFTRLAAPLALALCALTPTLARAQEHIPSKVEVAWNRYYTHAEMNEIMRRIEDAYPDIVRVVKIGESLQGREMLLAVVTNRETGPDTTKPGMWIDGNVHGNEIQSAEAVLYSLWYLAKAYGNIERLTTLIDETSLYLLPSQNPDGRDYWFKEANTPHSSRQNQRPVDDDRDGLYDEDPPDDLDEDGSITRMWKRDPNGRYIRDRHDPRIFRRVEDDEQGEWTLLGSEGIDNDGDGRINEDGPGGDDMNRNWPSGWQPTYVQYGAGPYPFSAPETRAVGEYILTKPNIHAGQSYHNTGGMLLRGPGARHRESLYPGADRRVYNELGRVGEELLPYYNYWVIYRDLYTVHGGFVNWLAEGLGMYAFTNELWTAGKYFQRDVSRPDEEQRWLWRDRVDFGQTFKDYEAYEHPEHGTVLIGGPNKWSSRNTPTFMLEEECHRNFAFTMFHADHLPRLKFDRVDAKAMGAGVWQVRAEIENTRLLPTRSALQAEERIGRNDLMHCLPPAGGAVVAGGVLEEWDDHQMREARDEPGRIQLEEGVGSRGRVIFRFVVTGSEGGTARLRYEAERARNIEAEVDLP